MKKRGFTIAELLVTMAIVGVVAALTMPTLVSSYNKKVWAKSLAPAISDFETAMQTMLVRENVDTLFETKAWSEATDSAGDYVLYDESSPTKLNKFVKNLSPYLKIKSHYINALTYYGNDVCIKTLNAGANYDCSDKSSGEYVDDVVFTTSKGVAYFMHFNFTKRNIEEIPASAESDAISNGTRLVQDAAEVRIDVNGKKSPNTYGRDIFFFILGQDGVLYPYGGKDSSRFSKGSDIKHWTNTCKDGALGNGSSCTARVIENGFVMDY